MWSERYPRATGQGQSRLVLEVRRGRRASRTPGVVEMARHAGPSRQEASGDGNGAALPPAGATRTVAGKAAPCRTPGSGRCGLDEGAIVKGTVNGQRNRVW